MSIESLVLQASWIMVLVTMPLAILSLIIGKLKGVKFTVPDPKDEKSPFSLGGERPKKQTRMPVTENLVTMKTDEEEVIGIIEESEMDKPKKKEESTGTMCDLFPSEEPPQPEQKPKQEDKLKQKQNGEEEPDRNVGGRPKTPVIENGGEFFEIVARGTEGAIEVQVEDAKIMLHGIPLKVKTGSLWIKPKTAPTKQAEPTQEEDPFKETEEEGQQ